MNYLAPLTTLLPLGTLMTLLAQAQSVTYNGNYNGPKVDVNFITTPPAQYQECREKYINSTAKVFNACSFGVDEARRMAERFGGGKGRTEGYLRGFSWGLYHGVQNHASDPQATTLGAALNSDLLGRIDRAVQSGANQGQTVGTSNGSSEARRRFSEALDSALLPSSRLDRIPEPSFSSSIHDPYIQYVGQPPTIQSLLHTQNLDLASIKIYSSYDTVFLGDTPQFKVWDYYFSDGTYRYEVARWVEPGAAFQQWTSRPIDSKPQYEALGTDSVVIPVPSPAPGAPTNTTQTIDLKEIFKKSFMNAYAYYVNYYFSQSFYTQLDEGQRVGEAMGSLVGTQFARTTSEVKSFNEKFHRDEKAAYEQIYTAAYSAAFQKTFTEYSNTPKPEVDQFDLVDELDDGIIQPGERVGVAFRIKNFGGRSTSISVRVDGAESTEASPTYAVSAMKTTLIRTPFIAKMTTHVQSSANVNLTLNISGTGFNALNVQRTAEVIRQVTPVELEITPNVPEGKASIGVVVKNNSRLASSSSVRVVINDDQGHTLERNLGIILAGQKSRADFLLEGMNPLELLKGSGTRLRAQMYLGDLAVDELQGVIVSKNPLMDLPYAFALSAQDAKQENLALALMNELNERIRQETDQIDRRGYRDQPGDTYLYGALSAYRSRNQSEVAQNLFSRFSNQIWIYRKRFSNFLGIKSANRVYFEAACRELNQGRKL